MVGPMMVTVQGAAEPETVWRRYLYPELWSSWAPHLTGVQSDTPVIAAGTRGTVKVVHFFTAHFRISHVDTAARTWTCRVRFGPFRLLLEHGLDADHAGTRAWIRIWGPTPVLVLYRPLMRWALHRLMRG